MAYFVKELFYTIQGEGVNSGRPAVFLRFSGCNLWTGQHGDRGKGSGTCSVWCDTDFVGIDGPSGGKFESATDLASAVRSKWRSRTSRPFVVCTGGEPLLQLDGELVKALHREDFQVAVETNGTRPVPTGLDWICVSPKAGARLTVQSGDELKFVYPQSQADPEDFESLDFRHFCLQPMDGPDLARNIKLVVQYCLEHPRWRLSLQTHKFLGVP
jgi:7-carboxy-7-deazaguanine synthase